MDLYSFLSHADLGAPTGEGSSAWGWTDPESGREFVGKLFEESCDVPILILLATGAYEGTALVEINKEGQLIKLGFM